MRQRNKHTGMHFGEFSQSLKVNCIGPVTSPSTTLFAWLRSNNWVAGCRQQPNKGINHVIQTHNATSASGELIWVWPVPPLAGSLETRADLSVIKMSPTEMKGYLGLGDSQVSAEDCCVTVHLRVLLSNWQPQQVFKTLSIFRKSFLCYVLCLS